MDKKKQHWFFRIWVYDRAGALTSIASAFSNRGISLDSVVGHGSDKSSGCAGTVLATFTCTEADKQAIKRVVSRLSKIERVEEHPYLGDNLRKTAVVKTERKLAPKDVVGETSFLTCELMSHNSTGWTYFLGGSPAQLDPILHRLKKSAILLDQVYSITAL
ncbi:MAG: ACT domain-containing protein [Kiritimatiellae bacterium]|nr:ACT domain-containing protein [Kiritimatiellia bacterium]